MELFSDIKYNNVSVFEGLEGHFGLEYDNLSEINNAPYLVLFVTDECNLDCKYCFCKNNKKTKNDIPKYSYKDLTDFLSNNHFEHGTIRFFGGEPLLNKKWIFDCIDFIKKQGLSFDFNIFTNATLIDKDFIELCKQENVKLFLSIEPSMDMCNRIDKLGNNIYEIVKENIKVVKENGYIKKCIVRAVYSIDCNIDLFDFAKQIIDMGFPMVSITFPWTSKDTDYALDENKIEIFRDHLKKFVDNYINRIINKDFRYIGVHPFSSYINSWFSDEIYLDASSCGAGKNLYSISTDGSIYPCHSFNGIDEFKEGNIVDKHFPIKLFDNVSSLTTESCKNCFLKYTCRSRCLADAYFYNGDILNPNKYKCLVEKDIVSASAYIYQCIRNQPELFNIYKRLVSKGADFYGGNN